MRKREFRSRKTFLVLAGISAALNALLWVTAIWIFPQEGPTTLLPYDATPPLAGLAVLVGNSFLAFLLRNASIRASAVLSATALAVQVILLLSFVTLWRLTQ